jgi:PAS domain-containing protein
MEIGLHEKDGELLQSYGAVQDTTEYHRLLETAHNSEERYSSLFSQMPLGFMEQDYSSIKQKIDSLRADGVEDIRGYLEAHGDLLRELIEGTTVTAVNDALLALYGAKSLEEFTEDDEDVASWWNDEWVRFYASEISNLLNRDRIHEADQIEERMDGSFFQVRMITKVLGSQGGGRTGEQGQKRIPRHHEPRNPHSDERRARHDRAADGHRSRYARAAPGHNRPSIGGIPARDHQPHPRFLQDRSRQDGTRRRGLSSA